MWHTRVKGRVCLIYRPDSHERGYRVAKMIKEVQNAYMHLKIKALNLLPEVMESPRRENCQR